MAFDVVTAKQGKPHVTADQQALMQAGMLGKGRYALDALNNLACTMTDSNTLTVDTGGLMVDGRWVVNEAQTSFSIANGSQAQFRKDLAVLEITVDQSTGVTSLEEKVLQGATAATAAAAADPTYEPGDLYTGLTAVVPIARITLDGLTPTCEALLPSVADLKTISEQTKKLGDSVSSICSKNFTVSQSRTPYGGTLEKVIDISMEGYKPLGIVGFTSNHNGSFPFTECCFIDDTHARVAFMNLVPNQGDWGYSEATITVLYIRR